MDYLRAGVSEVVITPPSGTHLCGYFQSRKSKGIRDDLYAKCLVLDNGQEKLTLVVCDLIGISKDEVNTARRLIKKATGIPGKNIMIAATHTHTGPYTHKNTLFSESEKVINKDWLKLLPKLIAGGVMYADNKKEEIKIGVGKGSVDNISFNRRYKMKNGMVITNPGSKKEVLGPAGPINPEVGIVKIEDLKGKVLTVLVNFACHADIVGGNWISADWPGALSRVIKKSLGENVVVLVSIGPSGNINHLDIEKTGLRGYSFCKHFASTLAKEVLRTVPEISCRRAPRLTILSKKVDLSLQIYSKKEVEQAKKTVKKVGKKTDLSQLFAESILERVKRQNKKISPEIQAFRIDDFALVTNPGEYFVEYALKIKEESSLKPVFLIELANDSVGYIPTPKAFQEEQSNQKISRGQLEQSLNEAIGMGCSYETSPIGAYLDQKSGDILAEKSLALLKRLAS